MKTVKTQEVPKNKRSHLSESNGRPTVYETGHPIDFASDLGRPGDGWHQERDAAYFASQMRRLRGAIKRQPLFNTWRGLVARCTRVSDKDWPAYGGRGITVCDRWLGAAGYWHFEADMSPRPTGLSIERIDNALGYSPENCRWATQREQCSNTRRTRTVTIEGETKTVAEWARHPDCKVIRQRIVTRLNRGWPVRDAVFAGEGVRKPGRAA